MSAATEQVDLYERQARVLRKEISGLTSDQLGAHPVPGTWSIGQIVTHLCDADQAFADRVKRIIAEEPRPALLAWDENRWMQHLPAERGPASDTAMLFELVRTQLAWILRGLAPEAFKRTGMHSQAGEQTVMAILEKATWHFEHHLKFLREKKALVLGAKR